MERHHILGMICGYCLSRFNERAYSYLGHPTQQATHTALGKALSVPAESIKNWRDEFDPIHDNSRQGWHKREMYPSRRRVLEALGGLSEGELLQLVLEVTSFPSGQSAEELVTAVGEPDSETDGGAYALRGPTGARAEDAFRAHHERSGDPVPGRLMDRRHDQCGFDFEIIAGDRSIAVEVKGLAGATGGVTFTDKEWSTARTLGDTYYLALVRDVASEPQVSLIRNPAVQLEAKMRTFTVVQVGWSVGEASIRRLAAT